MDEKQLDFDEIRKKCSEPAQERYESVRLNLLGQASVEELSDYTGHDRRTLQKRVEQFHQGGLKSLFDKKGSRKNLLPDVVEECIRNHLEIFAELGHAELSRIVFKKTGLALSRFKISELRKKLENVGIQQKLPLDKPRNAQAMRIEVIRLHYDGWSPTSIARYLPISRRHVYRLIDRFEEENFAGLVDGDSTPSEPTRKVHFGVMATIYQLQMEYPAAGRFRIHGLLKRQFKLDGEELPKICERTVGRYMEFHREFYPELQNAREQEISKPKPPPTSHLRYRATRPHEMWYVDFRHLDTKLDGKVVYSICILEGFSRAILFGEVYLSKAAWVVLEAFHGAIALFGRPEIIISDNENQFVGKDLTQVCRSLGIEHRPIDKRKSFQTLIETFFNIQRRLADFKFTKAKSFSDFQRIHAEFIETYNHTEHWGLVQDERNYRTPAEALGWVRGFEVEQTELSKTFESVQLQRKTDKHGFIKVHSWRVYAEEGLPKTQVELKASPKQLTIEHREEILAIYPCEFDYKTKKVQKVGKKPRLFETQYRSPQLHLFYREHIPWEKAYQLPSSKPFTLTPKPFTQLDLAL